jgi:hypothetical protein
MMEPPLGSQTDIALGAIPTRWLGKREDISLYDTFLFVFCHDIGTFYYADFCQDFGG